MRFIPSNGLSMKGTCGYVLQHQLILDGSIDRWHFNLIAYSKSNGHHPTLLVLPFFGRLFGSQA